MALCPLCEQESSAICPKCRPADLEALKAALQYGGFPASALPSVGLVRPFLAEGVRLHLLNHEFNLAEASFLEILRGLRGHAKADRDAAAAYFDCYAAFLEQQGRVDEARRMRSRADASRKDPTELLRKAESQHDHRGEAFNAELRRLQDDTAKPTADSLKAVNEELERSLAAQEARLRALKIGVFGFAGLASGFLLGVNLLVTGVVGAGLGFAVARKR